MNDESDLAIEDRHTYVLFNLLALIMHPIWPH